MTATNVQSIQSALPAPGSFGAWWLAARPKTLLVGIVPVAIGTAVAYLASRGMAFAGAPHPVRWGPAFAALVGAILIQIGTNFANDVFDFEKGADDERRLGPVRAAQAGLLSPEAIRRGMVVCFGAAMVVGVYLTSMSGWPIVVIGLLSIASGIAYTGGPYPLGYNGLGDVFVFVFFGFVAVVGTTLVANGAAPGPLAYVAAIPVGALATAVLVVNNVRDHETDVEAGKRTLVVRWGRRFGLFEYAVVVLGSYGVVIALVLSDQLGVMALAPLLSLPLGLKLVRDMFRLPSGPELNPVLGKTAGLMALFGLLWTIGLAAAAGT